MMDYISIFVNLVESRLPTFALELGFVSLLQHVDWFPVLNETFLHSVLHAFAERSVLSGGHLLFYESFLMLAVYWNPYKYIGYLYPEYVREIPDSVLLSLDHMVKYINVFIVEVLWRLRQLDFGYPEVFRVKEKALAFLLTTYVFSAPPELVTLYSILVVVYNYFFHFNIKTIHDLILFIIIGSICWSFRVRPRGSYVYLYLITSYLLFIVWVNLKYRCMNTAKDRRYRIEQRVFFLYATL